MNQSNAHTGIFWLRSFLCGKSIAFYKKLPTSLAPYYYYCPEIILLNKKTFKDEQEKNESRRHQKYGSGNPQNR